MVGYLMISSDNDVCISNIYEEKMDDLSIVVITTAAEKDQSTA